MRGYAVAFTEQFGTLVEHFSNFFGRPDVEHPLLVFSSLGIRALGVERAVETTVFRSADPFGMGHLAPDPFEGFADDLCVALLAGRLIAHEVDPRELGVVVQHLLEMGDDPLAIRRIPMKPAAELVVHPPIAHRIEGFRNDRAVPLPPGAISSAQEVFQSRGLGELRPVLPESAVFAVRTPQGGVRTLYEDAFGTLASLGNLL